MGSFTYVSCSFILALSTKTAFPLLFHFTVCINNKQQIYEWCTDKGSDGKDVEIILPAIDKINALMTARQQFAYGDQIDFFDHNNCIAWRRTGNGEHEGCLIILSNGDEGNKHISLGDDFSNAVFYDFLQK